MMHITQLGKVGKLFKNNFKNIKFNLDILI